MPGKVITEGKTYLSWQRLENVHHTKTGKGIRDESLVVHRAKVLGGWLVRCHGIYELHHKYETGSGDTDYEASAGFGLGLTFVPDPKHEWNPSDYQKDHS